MIKVTKEKGITLVALIITVIILIILAAVTIYAFAKNKLIEVAINGTINYANAQVVEEEIFNQVAITLDEAIKNIEKQNSNIENIDNLEEPEIEILEKTANSFKINIKNNYSGNVQFEYYINGELQGSRTSNTSISIENLLPNSNYNIVVVVYQGEKSSEKSVNVETQADVLVVFDNGNQCESITQGWYGVYNAGNNPSAGTTEISDLLKIKTWGIWTSYIITTKGKIEMTDYSKLIYEVSEDYEGNSYSNAHFGVFSSSIPGAPGSDSTYVEYSVNNRQTKVIYDISDKKGEFYIWFGANNGRNISVSKIYLEK